MATEEGATLRSRLVPSVAATEEGNGPIGPLPHGSVGDGQDATEPSDEAPIDARNHNVDLAQIQTGSSGQVVNLDLGAEDLHIPFGRDEVVFEGDLKGDGRAAGDTEESHVIEARCPGRAQRPDCLDETCRIDVVARVVDGTRDYILRGRADEIHDAVHDRLAYLAARCLVDGEGPGR